uniref:Reverse transcriptase domain-containing protein n=2 Tax=Meloidogyne incognita TaxID=6306 RepID=A0A914MK59_MELIC
MKRNRFKFSGIPLLNESEEGDPIILDTDKANKFKNIFEEIVSGGKSNIQSSFEAEDGHQEEIIFEPYIIEKLLKKLPNKLSHSPENINQYFLKKCATPLALPLSILYENTFKTGIVPELWKTAHILPIFKKKGSVNDPKNYRPIALTSPTCRVFERIIANNILEHLYKHKLIAEEQFGFLPKSSCTLQILSSMQDWYNSLDRKIEIVSGGKSNIQSSFEAEDGHQEEIIFEPYIIEKLLKKLPNKLSHSPENINQYFLKKCATPLALPLSILYENTFKTGIVPELWKTAHILPIFKKKGSVNDPKNYRPIALTSPTCRVFERIIANNILEHLYKHKLIAEEQFGFLPKSSCTLQILSSMQDWYNSLDRKIGTDVIYFDFEKAFDKVDHQILIRKLQEIKIDSLTIRWIANFLSNRSHIVKIGDHFSEPFLPKTGVPQGTVLGPLLFLIYINDLPKHIPKNIKVKLYADDFKLYSEIKTEKDCLDLQGAINNAYRWAKNNRLEFSISKIHM